LTRLRLSLTRFEIFLQEIKCLQDNYEKLQERCQKSIGEFTEEESEVMSLGNVDTADTLNMYQ
jgi:hypothetical protein